MVFCPIGEVIIKIIKRLEGKKMEQDLSRVGLKPFTVIGILILLIWGIFSIYDCWSPPVVPESAPPDQFSAERAIKLLEYPTKMIHTFGSQENAKVREYLIQKLRLLGVEPEVYTGYVKHSSKHGYNAIDRVGSIMVVLPGYAPTRAILLMGHYDSTPYGVACADDGSAVATMYETLRALLHSPPLKNDVIFLFTNGEEAGLLGPRAFLDHPLYEKVGLCLNFEARGHYGPSMMFQMSNNNSWLIKEFAKVVPYPRASSMMFEIAGKMPTSTDYYVLKPKGVPGFDFAFVGGIRYYHTPNDNIEHISLRSLQHHGEYALPLVKHFGNLDLSHLKIGYPFEEPVQNSIYFPLPGNQLVTYSEKWVLPLFVLAIVLYGVMLFSMRLFWGIRVRDVFFHFIRNIVHTLLVISLLGGLIGLSFLIYKHYIVYYELTYFLMGLLTTTGLFLIFLPIIFARFDPHLFFASALLPWLGLSIYSSIATPTASYISQWILIIGSVCGIIGSFPHVPQKWQRNFIWYSFWTLIPTLVTIYFVSPFLILGVQTLTPVFIPVLMIFLIFIFYQPVGIIQNILEDKKTCYRWGMILLVAGLLVYAYPMLFFRFTKETPKTNHLCYGLDWDTGKAWWMTRDTELDEWTEQFFTKNVQFKKPEPFTGDDITVRFGEAPVASYPPPLLSVLEDRSEGDIRHLKISLVSLRKPAELRLKLKGEFEVLSVKINDKDFGNSDGRGILMKEGILRKIIIEQSKEFENSDGKTIPHWYLNYRGFPAENGITLEWQLRSKQPLILEVIEKSYVIPPIPGIDMPPRPDYMIAEPNTVEWWKPFRSNAIYTRKTFTLN